MKCHFCDTKTTVRPVYRVAQSDVTEFPMCNFCFENVLLQMRAGWWYESKDEAYAVAVTNRISNDDKLPVQHM